MDFIFFINNGKNYNKSIVQSIGFHDELYIGNPISKNRNGGECLLKRIESIVTGGVKIPQNVYLGKAYQ